MKQTITYERLRSVPVWDSADQHYRDVNMYVAKCTHCGDAEIARMEEGVSLEVFHQQITIHLLEHVVDKIGGGSIVG